MADDWQVGDLALCVSDGWVHTIKVGGDTGFRPRVGSVHQVVEVASSADKRHSHWPAGILALAFPPSPHAFFNVIFFRKIRPLTDEERRSFVAELDCPVLQPNQEVAQTVRTDGRP